MTAKPASFTVRKTCGLQGLRTALLAGVVLGFSGLAGATTPDELLAETDRIERRISEGDGRNAESAGRAALRQAEAVFGANVVETANLHRLIGDALFIQRRYGDAEPHFRAALSMRETLLGDDAPETALSALDLAHTLRSLDRLDEAELFYRRALAIRTVAHGETHADTAETMRDLATLLRARGKHQEAAAQMSKSVDATDAVLGSDHPTSIRRRGLLAAMLDDAGEIQRAEALYRDVIDQAIAHLPDDRASRGSWRNGLAKLLFNAARFQEAEVSYRQALADRVAANGAATVEALQSLEGVALSLESQRRYGDAVEAMQQAVDIRRQIEGEASAALATASIRLAINYRRLNRPAEAETALRRALSIREAVLGADSPGVADVSRMLGSALSAQKRDAEAELHHRRALTISDRAYGSDHLLTAFDMMFLGIIYTGQRRFAEAEPLLSRAVAIMEASPEAKRRAIIPRLALVNLLEARGRTDDAALQAEKGLADAIGIIGARSEEAAAYTGILSWLRSSQSRHAEAEELARKHIAMLDGEANGLSELSAQRALANVLLASGRAEDALAIHEAVLSQLRAHHGDATPAIRRSLDALGRAHYALGRFREAAEHLERAVDLAAHEAERDAPFAFEGGVGPIEDRMIATGGTSADLVRAWFQLGNDDPRIAEKAFVAAQRINDSKAAAALSQLNVRHAAGSSELATLVRERQDLKEEWQQQDLLRTAILATPLSARDANEAASVEAGLLRAQKKLDAIDTRLARDFPEFASLQKPAAASIQEARTALGDNEVLLYYADMARRGVDGSETFVWVVPKTGDARWIRLKADSRSLSDDIRQLRGMMGVGPQTRGAASLVEGNKGDRTDRVLASAHDLYNDVLAPVADLISGKDLVIVPSDHLAGLPFHLLVSSPPESNAPDRYRDARWIARDHAISVLPSVSALLSISGENGAETKTRSPYLGFANPLLTGPSNTDRRAFERESCITAGASATAVAVEDTSPLDTLFRGAAADVEAVRRLAPLPETLDEACAIAEVLGADSDRIRHGAAATETAIKQLSQTGDLAKTSIIHFATHGLISGELAGLAEPAIVLTPPETASDADDGLLTASEVSVLKLDADWVILSACNTAAGDSGGEALSGLARAFFYAGARALMVSHWPVNSDAAVRLATGAIDELSNDPSIGRAEALRRSMAAEIARGGHHADPANWAPFILVGSA